MSDCDNPICIKVPQVIGIGECQVVVVSDLNLSHRAVELKRVGKQVTVDTAVIANGKVLINGTVHKNVEYQDCDHHVDSDKFDIFFDCCLDVPGAEAGDDFQTEAAEVVVEEDQLEMHPRDEAKQDCNEDDDHKDRDKKGEGYCFLFEKMCVHVRGKVTREVQITVNQITPGICPT